MPGNDFVRDMTQGGAGFSFAEMGAPFGNIGKYGGMGADMLFRMMYPNHMLMQASQGTAFERMRSANNMTMQARLQEQFSRIHTDQMRSMMQQMGLGATTSSVLASGASMLGMRPQGAIGGRGISALMDLASSPSNNYMLTEQSTDSVSRAFESYFNFDYRARGIQAAGTNVDRRQQEIALQRARYLRRTGGLGRDDAARGLVALQRTGLMDARISNWQKRDGKLVDVGYMGRARRALDAALGDTEVGTLERMGVTDVGGFRKAVSSVRAENPNMTETEIREEALNRMGANTPRAFADVQREVIEERGSKLMRQYGRSAVLGGAGSLARAMQFKEGNAGPMFQALKAMKDVGFGGELTDLIEGLGQQFGANQALNPNFIKSMAADIRSVREATGMAFGEVANYMQLLSKVPGAQGMSGSRVTGMAAEAASVYQEGVTGPMGRGARMFFQKEYAARTAIVEGAPVAGVQRFLAFGGGTDADKALMAEIGAIEDVAARRKATNTVIRGGRYKGQRLSENVSEVGLALRRGGPRAAAMQRALREMEGVFENQYATVNDEYQKLTAKGSDMTADEKERLKVLTAERSQLLARRKSVTGAAEMAYDEARGGVRRSNLQMITKAFGGDERTGLYVASQLLTREAEGGTPLTFKEMQANLSALGVEMPAGMNEQKFATLRAGLAGIRSGRERSAIRMAGMAGFYGVGREQARRLADAASSAFATRVNAVEALASADPATKRRIFNQLMSETKGFKGVLQEVGIDLTPTGELVGAGGELAELVGAGPLDEAGRKRLASAQGEIYGLAAGYAASSAKARLGKAAVDKKIKEVNERRAKQGLDAIKNDPQSLKAIQDRAKGGKGTSDDEREILQAMAEVGGSGMSQKADAALGKLRTRAEELYGKQAAGVIVDWAKKQSTSIEAAMDGVDLKSDEENARKGGEGSELTLSGSVRLVVEDDALKLLFDMANGDRKSPKKPGKGG